MHRDSEYVHAASTRWRAPPLPSSGALASALRNNSLCRKHRGTYVVPKTENGHP
jgi:hypothetical protein